MIEATNTGYLIIDKEGRVIDANQEYVRLTGHHKLNEIVGRSVIEWTADYEKERNAEAIRQCIRDGFIKDVVIDYVDKNGHTTPIEINAAVIRAGETTRVISLCRDISERKKVEETLKDSEQKYRELYESFDEAFIATDWEFNVIHWNKAAERVTTVQAKDALGKKIYAVLPEMLAIDVKPYFEALKEKKPARFMMNVISRETKRLSVFEISTYPSSLGIIIIVEDKTEEEETKRLSVIGATAGMVGHDILFPCRQY